MKITILCSDHSHPVNKYLDEWIAQNNAWHQISLIRQRTDLSGGDMLFLVSCSELIQEPDRRKYKSCLVLHASDLPRGRGWSPHIWEIISGAEIVTVSLIEAEEKLDSGRIWKKIAVPIPKHYLWDEINKSIFTTEIELLDYAIKEFENIQPVQQPEDVAATYYERRSPEDSEISSKLSIKSQFDKIRVCDPHRFPAFFDLHGHRFKLIVEKMDE